VISSVPSAQADGPGLPPDYYQVQITSHWVVEIQAIVVQ
jgi:hypothetical protein